MKYFLIPSFFAILTLTAYADKSKLSVSGEATLSVPADKVTLLVGVETYDEDVKKATQLNAKKMQDVHDALKNMGLSEKELQTKNYMIAPRHTPTPHNPPADWKPAIIGYEVRNTLEVSTSKLELAGTLIDVASNAGANFIHSISFTLQNEEKARGEAITQAIRHAEFYAQAAVKEAGLKLGEITDLSVNPPASSNRLFKGTRSFGAQETSTVISPQEIEVSATVSIEYKIEKD